MFESNDDVDVDDEFLNGVFEDEPEEFCDNTRTGKHHFNVIESQQNFGLRDTRRSLSSEIVSREDGLAPEKELHFPVTPNLSNNQYHRNVYENSIVVASNHNDHKRKNLSPPVPLRSKRERKFPGPAGLLPDRKSSRITPVKLDSLLESDKSPPSTTADELCSQGRCSGSVLEEEPWQNLLTDLGPDRSILEVVNVASIKRKAAARCFVGKKVPFLAAVLHHLDVSSPDPCIILRDTTGEIHGTLHREVWEQFAAELVVGSVLVMRNVGLLSTGLSSRRHYLNITANNLATIYSSNSENSRKTRLHHFSGQDFTQMIKNWRSLVSPSHGIGSPASVQSLFNTSLSNSPVSSPRILNPSGSINKRTEVDQKLLNVAQRVSSQQTPRPAVPSRGNNLLPSIVPRGSPTPSIVRHSLPSCSSRSFGNLNCTNSSQNINRTSHLMTSNVKHTQVNNPSTVFPKTAQNSSSSSKPFKFDPVIVTPERNIKIFPPKSPKGMQSTTTPTSFIRQSPDLGNNNCKVMLSQSSQLTAEEQSLVESVFDGIDADSLFDDDF